LFQNSKTRMQEIKHRIRGPGETELFVRQYLPPSSGDGRTLMIVHGAGEHSGRYEHFIQWITQGGWTVIAGDLRGHGYSNGVPTHVDDFDQYIDDLAAVWAFFDLHSERTMLFGHSLGGLVAARFAERKPDWLAGLVLTSPLLSFGLRVPVLKRTLGRMCLWFAPRTRFRSTVSAEQLTRNEEALEIRARDPLTNRTVTAGWYFRVLEALCNVWDEAPLLTAPVLLLQGDADEIVNPQAPLDWLPQLGGRDRTLKMFPGHLHSLLTEPSWESTTADILRWMNRRIPGVRGDSVQQRRTAEEPEQGVPGLGTGMLRRAISDMRAA
jgi:lysophospholipase